MKKRYLSKYNLISLMIMFFIVISITLIPKNDVNASSDSIKTSGSWSYKISDGTASIYSYNGSSSSVTVPSTFIYDGTTYKLRKIEDYAFEGNTKLKTVVIPESITSLGYGVFKNCTNLSSVTINGNIGDCNDRSIDWPSEERSVFYNAGTNTASLKVTFGSSVTRIPAYIFATDSSKSDGNYVHITSLVIPSSVTEIGSYAFWNCYDLSSITWGENLKTIETYAFYNNIALKSVSLPSKTTSLEAYAFEGCTGITTVTLPKATKNLGYGVFKNCTNLSSVTINGNIGDCNDRSIDWPSEEKSVFYNAGTNTTSLKVTFGSSVTRIPAYIFATDSSKSDDNYVHITSLVIPDKVTEIGSYAFNNCYDLKTIKWGNAIQKIDSGAFKNCSELTSITLPSTVKKIGNAAFNGCSKLAKATIKAKKVEYGATVFDNCSESLKIYCYRGSTVATYAKNNSIKYSYLDPANVSISSVSNTSSGVKITWKKAAGASGYYVYRKTQNTGYKRIKTISGAGNLTYTDTAVKDKNGSTYYYTVKAYSSTGSSSSYTTKKIVRLKGISIASLKNTSGKKMYVSWGKNTKCSGYQIQYSTSSSFKSTKTVTVSGYKNVSKTISSLTKGKNYYVRVRAYKKSSNVNYYSAWSTAKSVKISK